MSKYPIHEAFQIPDAMLASWQVTVDLLAEAAGVSAALIMRVFSSEIETLLASQGSTYHSGERGALGSGYYCETVMETRRKLLVPNALKDPDWTQNPDIKLGMISYCGLPLTWPDGHLFGTLCLLDTQENVFAQRVHHLLARFCDSIQLGLAQVYAANREAMENAYGDDRLYHLLDAVPIPFGYANKAGKIKYINACFTQVFGYTSADLPNLATWWLRAYPDPSYRTWVIRAWHKATASADSEKYDIPLIENQITCQNGEIRTVEISGVVSGDDVLVMLLDVTERKQAAEKFSSFNRDFEAFLNQTTDFVYFKDLESRFRFCSQTLAEVTGHKTWHEMLGKHDREVFPPELASVYEAEEASVLAEGKPLLRKVDPYDDAMGQRRYVQTNKWPLFDAAGNIAGVFGISRDITEQKRAEEELRIAAATFNIRDAILITDSQANIIRVNQAFQDITGYCEAEALGRNPRFLSSQRHKPAFYRAMWQQLLSSGSWSGEMWDKRKNGQIYPKWLTITAIRDAEDAIGHYVAVFSDITERKSVEEEIHHLAFYDTLTNLPNRRLLLERLSAALSASVRSHRYGAVLFLDMDRFKVVNDMLGHDYGDLFLIEVSRRIQTCVRDSDTVARFGGDEFVILLEGVSKVEEDTSYKVSLIAEKIRDSLGKAYLLNEHEYHSSPSIGVCLYRGKETPVEDLLKHADMAMYQAKDAGRNAVRFFSTEMQHAVEVRAALEVDLRHAVAEQQLELHYQVQVDDMLNPIGAEALIRWKHPRTGMVSPAQFIPLAEESLLIVEIGDWVLETACRQLAAWSTSERTRQMSLAVNVSAKQFNQGDFVEKIATLLRKLDVEPTRLKIELTESLVLNNVAAVVYKMQALRALGVQLSMDDFGTGYSSLSYLKQLPLNQIKIDQSFVRDMTTCRRDVLMIQTIIDMAKNFGLDIIAEGVETEAQQLLLKDLGCVAYQGYFFGKPMPIAAFEDCLSASAEAHLK